VPLKSGEREFWSSGSTRRIVPVEFLPCFTFYIICFTDILEIRIKVWIFVQTEKATWCPTRAFIV
jgi:hypothetical protein